MDKSIFPVYMPSYGRYGGDEIERFDPYEGMTLRQWYAGLAMQGAIVASNPNDINQAEMVAAVFNIADAMIEADK